MPRAIPLLALCLVTLAIIVPLALAMPAVFPTIVSAMPVPRPRHCRCRHICIVKQQVMPLRCASVMPRPVCLAVLARQRAVFTKPLAGHYPAALTRPPRAGVWPWAC
jgi:hypothetical protein